MSNFNAIMSYFPWRRKTDNSRKTPKKPTELLIQAASAKNFALFSSVQVNKLRQFQLEESCGPDGMSPFHLVLQQTLFEIVTRKKQEAINDIVTKILASEVMRAAWLNKKNSREQTPLHLAVSAGYTQTVVQLLENGANFTLEDEKGRTALSLAAELGEDDIYNSLLAHHRKINQQNQKIFKKAEGYSLSQIESGQQKQQKKFQKRNTLVGGLGALMIIACPVATILAFDDIPLIGGILASFVPGIGPIIGLVTAVIFASLLIWAVHQKSSLKYGEHGQKLAAIEAKNAQLDSLAADLNHLKQQEKSLKNNPSDKKSLLKVQEQIEQKQLEIQNICKGIPQVSPQKKLNDVAWSKAPDVLKTRLLTAGSFLCAFSGVLGICSGLAPFLPTVAFASIVCAGIPVGGWIALGIALVVATGVAIWAHQVKFKRTLEEYGKARRELNEAEANLYRRSQKLCQENSYKNAMAPIGKNDQTTSSEESKQQFEKGPAPSKKSIRRKSLDDVSSALFYFSNAPSQDETNREKTLTAVDQNTIKFG